MMSAVPDAGVCECPPGGQGCRAAGRSADRNGAGGSVLLLALIAVVTFSAVSFFGSSNGGGFTNSAECIRKAYAAEEHCS